MSSTDTQESNETTGVAVTYANTKLRIANINKNLRGLLCKDFFDQAVKGYNDGEYGMRYKVDSEIGEDKLKDLITFIKKELGRWAFTKEMYDITYVIIHGSATISIMFK
jgi:hypothetical protein